MLLTLETEKLARILAGILLLIVANVFSFSTLIALIASIALIFIAPEKHGLEN
jgi:hypothetical protein